MYIPVVIALVWQRHDTKISVSCLGLFYQIYVFDISFLDLCDEDIKRTAHSLRVKSEDCEASGSIRLVPNTYLERTLRLRPGMASLSKSSFVLLDTQWERIQYLLLSLSFNAM